MIRLFRTRPVALKRSRYPASRLATRCYVLGVPVLQISAESPLGQLLAGEGQKRIHTRKHEAAAREDFA